MSDFRRQFYERYVSTSAGTVGERSEAAFRRYRAWSRLKILPLLVGVSRRSPVLELGCGAGNVMSILAHEGFTEVTGVDISSEMVEIARRRGLDVVCGDALEHLATTTQRFGAILAFDFIEHFSREELMALLPSIHERLLPGGVLVVQTPNGQGLSPLQVIYGDLTHLTILTPDSIEQLLRITGFTDIGVYETGPAPKSLTGVLRTGLWAGIKVVTNLVRMIETGKRQTVWTENMLCRSRRAEIDEISMPSPAIRVAHLVATDVGPALVGEPKAAIVAVDRATPARAPTQGVRPRVLLVGHALLDMMMDSYRRALEPYYEVRVVDPYSMLADLEKRFFGPHTGAQINRAMATLSNIAAGDPLAFAGSRILRAAGEFAPDIVLTDCVDSLSPKLVLGLRRANSRAIVLGQFGDSISNFGRGYFFAAQYDQLFFKDHYIVEKMRSKLAWREVYYLPQACDRHMHRTVALTDADRAHYGCDVGVYGNGYLYRAECLRPLLGRSVKIWGGGLPRWAEHETASLFTNHYVAGDEKCRAMLAAKIALNSNHYSEIAGTNKRTFELAAIGAFQLTDTPALSDVFDPVTEVATYETSDDMLQKIDYYLARPELRHQMATRAHARAHAEHTYEHRWVAMLHAAGLRPPPGFPVQPESLRVFAV